MCRGVQVQMFPNPGGFYRLGAMSRQPDHTMVIGGDGQTGPSDGRGVQTMAELRRTDGLAGPRTQGMFGANFGGRASVSDNNSSFNRPFPQSPSPNPPQRAPPPANPAPPPSSSLKINGVHKKLQRVKLVNSKLADIVPESKLVMQLVEMERRIAAECERTKLELEDLTVTPESTTQTLRLTIFNTHQTLQSTERAQYRENDAPDIQNSLNNVERTLAQPAQSNSWTLHITGKLVMHDNEARRASDHARLSEFGLDKYFDKV